MNKRKLGQEACKPLPANKFIDVIIEISKDLGGLNKRLDTLEAAIENVAQQYHQFAITFESVRPIFETIQTDILTVDAMRKELEYYKSEVYKANILESYELSPDNKETIVVPKKKPLITRKKRTNSVLTKKTR